MGCRPKGLRGLSSLLNLEFGESNFVILGVDTAAGNHIGKGSYVLCFCCSRHCIHARHGSHGPYLVVLRLDFSVVGWSKRPLLNTGVDSS